MRRTLTAGFFISLLLLVQGCIQDEVRVSVRPDGTGTIEERLLLSNTVTGFMEGMAKQAAAEGQEETPASEAAAEKTPGEETEKKDAATEKEAGKKAETEKPDVLGKMMQGAREKAAQFGSGVRFVSVAPEKTETASGYRAVYAFDDIRQVRIGREKGRMAAGPEDGEKKGENDSVAPGKEDLPAKADQRDDAIRFEFAVAADGAPATLTVRLPEKEGEKKGETESPTAGKGEAIPPEPMDPASLEMMQALFKDMRMSVAVRIEGSIVSTNATWRKDADITLMDLDFARILENRNLLQKMAAGKPESFADMKALFPRVEGLKFELKNPVVVRFQ